MQSESGKRKGKEELITKDGYSSKEKECYGSETKKEHATNKKEPTRNW